MKIDNRILIPVGLTVGLAAVILLSGREPSGPGGEAILRTPEDFAQTNERVKASSLEIFQRADEGEELTAADKATLVQVAKDFESMITYEPRRCGPNFGAGKAYMLLGDFEHAAERFEQCAINEAVDPAKDTSELKATVIEAKALASESLIEVAANYMTTGDKDLLARVPGIYNHAYALADEAVKAIPNSAKYLLARGQALVNLKKVEDAKSDIAVALALEPDNSKARSLGILVGLIKIEDIKKDPTTKK